MRRRSNSAGAGQTGRALVHGLSHEGSGVARVDGKTVFIDGALPGEEVEYEYLQRRRSYDRAVLRNLISISPDRVDPARCSSFGTCGGCSLQHLDPAAQIRAKQQILLENLERIGKVVPDTVYDPVTGPLWGYRRRARLGVRYVIKKETVLVGFRESSSSYIADMPVCEVLVPQVGRHLTDLRELVNGLSCRDRIPQLEVAAGDDRVALVFRHLLPLTADDTSRLVNFGERHGMQIHLQPGGPDSAALLHPAGAEPLSYRLPQFDILIRFLPTDFVQVNGEINRKMVTRAVELLELTGQDRVLDLFCGVGNFTLALARQAHSVTGIEGETTLVERARANGALNGIDNAQFVVANLDDSVDVLPEGEWNKVLLDPPRTGAMAVVKQFGRLKPERIVYVSCNPATLARDSEVLVQVAGYRMAGAGVLDMFPHTNHVESIALFTQA